MSNIAFLSAAHIHTRGFLESIAKKDDCRATVIWDDMAERGQRYADEYGAEYSSDLEAVVARDDIDGFIVCAENTRHLPLLEAAIPAGKPVFCEKPFTASVADASSAMRLVREHGTVVHMGYFQPFDGDMQGVAGVLERGELGKVTHARVRNAHNAAYGRWFDSDDLAWFHDPALAGGGAFMDMGTHAVHMARTFLGPVKRVSARIGNACGNYPDVDDNGIALLEFASGALGTVEASWVQTGGIGGLEITGSAGTLFNHPNDGYIVAVPGEEARPVAPGEARPTRVDRLLAAIDGSIDRAELDADLQCAVDSVAIMEACYKSAESGRWEDVAEV